MTYPSPDDPRVKYVMKQYGFDELTARRHVRDAETLRAKLRAGKGVW